MTLSIDRVTAWQLRCHDCSCRQSEIFESETLAREALNQGRVCEYCWSQCVARAGRSFTGQGISKRGVS